MTRLAVPAITVVIPVFNRAHIVGQAISSVLAQDVPGWSIDVVIVDDGSSDDLDGALSKFGEGVACLRHVRNKGAAAARNTGIAAAGGEYVAFLDSDDTWLPGKLTAQIKFMETHGHRVSCTAYLLKRPNAPEFVSPRYATRALGLPDLVWGCFVSPGSTLVGRREIFVQIGGLDEEMQRLEDWDWLLRYAKLHPLGFLAQPLARIEVAPSANAAKVFAALDRLEARHAAVLPRRQRRHFAAALNIERAAAHYRSGRALAGLSALARALCLAPVGNVALAAVLHNRIGRRAVNAVVP
jgi:glycosyltransferase involved in cell wall biosynthesis